MALIGALGQPEEALHPLVQKALKQQLLKAPKTAAPRQKLPTLNPPAHLQVQMPAAPTQPHPQGLQLEPLQQPRGVSRMENQAVQRYTNQMLKKLEKQSLSFGFKGEGFPVGAKTPMVDNRIVGLAREYMGTPYVFGGESPKGFDCSGLAQYIYAKVGINIPRTTYTQWTAKNGRSVGKRNLEPGDLVFFRGSDSKGGLPGHVGIYIGGGKMIDAPHTGSQVRVDNVWSFGGYMGARRFH